MYIISKHKDFYDGVAGTTGIDKTIVYERHSKDVEGKENFPEPFSYDKNSRFNWKNKNPFHEISSYDLKKEVTKYDLYSAFIVGFCGKLYIGWKFLKKNPLYHSPYRYGQPEYNMDIIFDQKVALRYIKENKWSGNLSSIFLSVE